MLLEPDPHLHAEIEGLDAEYLALIDTTTEADKLEIREFYREAPSYPCATYSLSPKSWLIRNKAR